MPDHERALEELRAARVWQPGGDGPAGRPERLELIRYLLDRGADAGRIVAAARRGDLHGLAFDLIVDEHDLDLTEMAAAIGVDPEEVLLLYRHLGVEVSHPDTARFGSDEVDFVNRLRRTLAVFPPEAAPEVMQSMAAAMSSMAAAAVGAFVGTVEPDLADKGDEFAWTKVIAEAGEGALDLMADVRGLFRQHLRIAIEAQRSSMRHVESRHLSELAVGFVDLVGYTSTTEAMPVEELVTFTSRFRHRAHDIVTSAGGRLVKHIGDEVMFSAVEPADACRIGLSLIESFCTSAALPRGGIAYGQLVARYGDLYGPVVNMASRLVDTAVPGELLGPAALSGCAPMEGLSLEPAGRRQLKGFTDPVEVVSVTLSPTGATP